jgi:hypothetical protein
MPARRPMKICVVVLGTRERFAGAPAGASLGRRAMMV